MLWKKKELSSDLWFPVEHVLPTAKGHKPSRSTLREEQRAARQRKGCCSAEALSSPWLRRADVPESIVMIKKRSGHTKRVAWLWSKR